MSDISQDIEPQGGFAIDPKSLPAILWARRWLIIAPAVLVSAGGVAAAFLLPPKYESRATILIESAQLPANLVKSSVTDAVEERIERIRQRVLSRGDLIQLIRANGLYPAEQRSMPLSAIVSKMRESVKLEAVSADIGARGINFGGGSSTVAFTVSFEYPQPAPAQAVVQQLVNRFLELDASNQTEQATGAANFIGEQAEQLQQRIREIENRITEIKTKNGAIITLGQMSQVGGGSSAVAQIDAEIDSLMAQNAMLAANPTSTGNGDLASLRAQLRSAEARLSSSHPDVLALRSQVAAAEAAGAGPTVKSSGEMQAAVNQQRISALRNARALAASQNAASQNAAARAPAILAQIDQLEKQADSLRLQYQSVGGTLVTAETSARMESEQKGERFSVADPPVVPDEPVSPNRPKLILGGIAGGIALGLALAFLVEMLLRPIRGVAALRAATGVAPLIIIPEIDVKTGRMQAIATRLRRIFVRKKVSA
ncbi:Wzz/FepE/Etk N-terminal domain-containing protein [Sphingomonas sp. ID0503]|uniref:Wzz/FepE/Etk N-terminal domain-containing protein n=1 Tax=Sphingomonas sp. ID0503 TaxID=3399691 RepID=UPI003AFA8A35